MTEKTKEIIAKYQTLEIQYLYKDSETDTCIGSGLMTYFSAVKCAILHVAEMLDQRNALYIREGCLIHEELLKTKAELEAELYSIK